MSFLDIVDTVLRTRSPLRAHFTIPPGQVLDPAADSAAFQPHASYFEIRLSQMYLRDQREYWREFVPLASFVSELLFDGQRREVPFVVGPDRLSSVEKISKGDRVQYINTRIAGPYPYEGDDFSLFAGLLRATTSDWAKRTLSLLGSIAAEFDPTKLSGYLKVAGPIVTALEGILGMDDVELRTGVKKTYTSPADPASPATGELQAGYELILRLSPDDVAPEMVQRFRVKEGRLFLIDATGSLREYDESDFLLIHLRPLTKRDDYTTFDFHRLHWKRVTSLIWEGKHEDAVQAMRMLAAALAQCPDLIYSHRALLLKEYRRRFDAELENYRDTLDPHPGAGRPLRGRTQPSVPARMEITEADLSVALHPPAHLRVDLLRSPEALLRGFDL